MSEYALYWVAPKGFEERASVIVAKDEQEARNKALSHPAIEDAVNMGSELACINLNESMSLWGYDIKVSKRVMYH